MLFPPSFLKTLDDLVRADLISQRDWYANCIFWSTLAVVVGCALEVPEVMDELWDSLFVPKTKRFIKWVASLGLGFVVLGVAGELCFEHWRSAYEGMLQDFGNILLLDAENRITIAQAAAGDAKESAQKAFKAANNAELAAKSAQNKAHIVEEKARNLELRIRSTSLHQETLEARLAWRTLTKEQRNLLRTDLAKLSKVNLRIAPVGADVEAQAFAQEMSEFLSSKDIGWHVESYPATLIPPPIGLLFQVPTNGPVYENDPLFPIAKLIGDLKAFGLSPNVRLDAELKRNEAILWVGPKVQKAP